MYNQLEWKRTKEDGMPIYKAGTEYNNFEIRSWPYDESGEGRFQVCMNDFHKHNCKTLSEAKDSCEELERFS